jgi:hypothetical protein
MTSGGVDHPSPAILGAIELQDI